MQSIFPEFTANIHGREEVGFTARAIGSIMERMTAAAISASGNSVL